MPPDSPRRPSAGSPTGRTVRYRGVTEEVPAGTRAPVEPDVEPDDDDLDVTNDEPDEAGPQETRGADPDRAGSPSPMARPGDRRMVEMGVRFAAPAPAARCLGLFLDAAAADPQVRQVGDSWWVIVHVPLDLGRELVELSDGVGHVRSEDTYLPDLGWGPPPATGTGVPADDLNSTPVRELVIAAGLYPHTADRCRAAVVLVPAARARSLLQRALDLQLTAEFRPVRMEPQLSKAADDEPVASAGTLVEIRLQAVGQRPHLPVALLSALDNDPAALVCREVSPQLLIQHDRFSPLTDRQLENVLAGQTWVLAGPPYGCWTVEPLATAYTSAWQLTTLRDCHRLSAGRDGWADEGTAHLPEPQPLSIVPAEHGDTRLDAVLLSVSDLAAARVLLEGHPLAEVAMLVPGRDHFLLIAGGGIVDQIPLGHYLTAVGPGPIYVAHGWRTEPTLPAAAWRSLFGLLGHRALVLQKDRTLAFDLSARRPVWELWAGEPPAVDEQIPDGAQTVLAELDTATAPAPSRPAPRSPRPVRQVEPEPETGGLRGFLRQRLPNSARTAAEPQTWQEQALSSELEGKLGAAARLYDQHGDPLRAARLYERAAHEQLPPGPD
jgi:FtsH ternary system domain X7